VPALEMILAEIKRVLSEYYRSESGTQVDSLILSGGTANMKGVVEYFQKALSIKTVVGNPFGRIEYDSALEQKLMKVKSQFAVSVGLALKGIEEHLSK
jgi:type IV pilus assembly protein PilM